MNTIVVITTDWRHTYRVFNNPSTKISKVDWERMRVTLVDGTVIVIVHINDGKELIPQLSGWNVRKIVWLKVDKQIVPDDIRQIIIDRNVKTKAYFAFRGR